MKRTLTLALPILALVMLLGISSHSSAVGLASVAPLPPVTGGDGRAGMCYSFYPDPDSGSGRPFMDLAYQAGSRWDRFDFDWRRLERDDGSWNEEGFALYDALVDELHAAGFNMVGILLEGPDQLRADYAPMDLGPQPRRRPPGWYIPEPGAVDDSVVPMARVAPAIPSGLYEPWDSWRTEDRTDFVNSWGRFVHEVVSRYGDRIKHWEMWNEPEWDVFWTGTEADYAQLLKVGYQATKATCSDCQVLFGGLHYWIKPNYYKEVLDILATYPDAAAHNYFFDVMSVHLYSRSSNTYDVVKEIRDEMAARGAHHPIWITETGVPMWGDEHVHPYKDKQDYHARPDEAAAYTVQSYANAWASGVERYFFFRTHDADMPDLYGEYFGLIRNNRSLRPAYVAYQVATTYLISPSMVTNWSYSSGVRRVTLWGTPWGKVSVLWNATPNQLTYAYPATLPTARLIDRRGSEWPIETEDGVYRLDLPGATANRTGENQHDYFIGGDPYLVIEEDTVPPSKPVVEPLDTTTRSPTVMIHCSATDDAAGIWGYELQVWQGSGPWQRWGRIHPTPIVFTDGEDGETYCFRVRAWDRAGNPGPWGDETPCTTLDLNRWVYVDVPYVFGDVDGDGHWSEGEPRLTDVSFRLIDEHRQIIAAHEGPAWSFTTRVGYGDYTLIISPSDWPSLPPGWLPRTISFVVDETSDEPIAFGDPIGLRSHVASHFLPTVVVGR